MKKILTLLTLMLFCISLSSTAQEKYTGKRMIVYGKNFQNKFDAALIDSITFVTVEMDAAKATVTGTTANSVSLSIDVPEECLVMWLFVGNEDTGFEEYYLTESCDTTITGLEADNDYEVKATVYDKYSKRIATGVLLATFHTDYYSASECIPSGSDLVKYYKEGGQTFNLLPDGYYTLSDTLDLGSKFVCLQGSKSSPATITCADGACFKFGNGIQLKNLNIDCTDNNVSGLLLMTDTPDASLSTEALGYKSYGATLDGYVMQNTVEMKNVNVKGLKNSLVYGNKTPWSLLYLTIDQCIVQLDNDGSYGVINMYGASNGVIGDLTVMNSTFYNLKANDKAYFLRYSNASNAQPKKIFGDDMARLSIVNNTFVNVFSGKDFANNLPNTKGVLTTVSDNIFYDVYRVYQIVQTNTSRHTVGNYIWWENTPEQTNDTSRTDSNGNPICTKADPGFKPVEGQPAFDFSQKNCGLYFTPAYKPLTAKAGDPRWLPTE